MKRFAMILFAAAMLVGGTGVASAQMHGGGMSGGMHGGGSWSGGGNGGGGGWHGGGGGWNGGGWHGGGYWHGGWYGAGWYGVGIGLGYPWWGWGWPGYYNPYYASYPAYPYYSGYPVSYDYSAPTYIQQDAPAYTERRYSSQGENYLYYCPDPAGYYPQVPACAKGWLRVVPSPGPGAPAQQ
jgi:hypothetical protein